MNSEDDDHFFCHWYLDVNQMKLFLKNSPFLIQTRLRSEGRQWSSSLSQNFEFFYVTLEPEKRPKIEENEKEFWFELQEEIQYQVSCQEILILARNSSIFFPILHFSLLRLCHRLSAFSDESSFDSKSEIEREEEEEEWEERKRNIEKKERRTFVCYFVTSQ